MWQQVLMSNNVQLKELKEPHKFMWQQVLMSNNVQLKEMFKKRK